MVRRFDDIFHNINNGFALDFLPWLFPFYIIHLAKLYYYGHFIRRFLLNTVINSRIQSWDVDRPKDFLDSILTNTGVCSGNKKPQLSCEYGFYELEDILGGHTAVSSFTTRILVQIAKRPDIQEKIREEIRYVTSTAAKDGVIRLCHRSLMPYTQAVILETLRITASPIIPHVATEDSTLGGYHVKKDSIIFLNNYQLNYSDEYWQEPHTFQPSR